MHTGFYDKYDVEVWCLQEGDHKLYRAIGVVCPCADILYHKCYFCDIRASEYVGGADAYFCCKCGEWCPSHYLRNNSDD